MENQFAIRDIGLFPSGERKITWVKQYMPLLNMLEQEYSAGKPFMGQRVLMCLHLEAKTAYLARVIQSGGAEVTVVASNPLSTQDDVVAALVQSGIKAFAWHGATPEEYRQHLVQAVSTRPTLIIDDGGDIVSLLHSNQSFLSCDIIGGCEETTTGVQRLRAMEKDGILSFPMIAVNDAMCKHLFDNRYGTGQSVWDGIMRTTNLLIAGKKVVVIGYGWCGKGVAMRAKGLGARVTICEVDPIRAIEALMDGFDVKPLAQAAREGEFFITVTGNLKAIRKEHFALMPDGAVLANAGHFDVEIDISALRSLATSVSQARPGVQAFHLSGDKTLYLLAEGRLVNLAVGDGHPAQIMDLSFALQAMSVKYLMENRRNLPVKVVQVPREIDERVARMCLASQNVEIDAMTEEQIQYLKEWRD